MKKYLLTLLVAFLSLTGATAATTADYHVVPLPQKITLSGKAPFVLTASTPVVSTQTSAEMSRNAQFLLQYVKEATGMQLATAAKLQKKQRGIVLTLDPKMQAKEGYRITVTDKQVTIAGQTATGVFYGIQTLRKSLPIAQGVLQIELPAGTIADAPRFSYRGLMLDCGRHFFPVSFVKEVIDLMALHNMNTFHWHLTEDQGWRLEIKKYPRLTEVGSIREQTVIGHNSGVYDGQPYGGYYTQDDCREIVRYAQERYITVIPEVDMPGHQLSALAAYPELGCKGGPYKVGQGWGVYNDVLCLGNEKTYQFCQDVLAEVMQIFPSHYINIGGDEAPHKRWADCPKDKALMAQTGTKPETVQGVFTNRIEKFINQHGRSIIGWDEILQGDVNQSATVMCWRDVKYGIQAAEKGHDVIMSPTAFLYFDYYQSKDWNEPLLIGGNLPIEKTYSFEPIPENATPEVKSHFIGVQGNLWTEYIGNKHLAEYQLLPRMAALSEIQWRSDKRDFQEFKGRLTNFVRFYDLCGATYAKHLWPEALKKARDVEGE